MREKLKPCPLPNCRKEAAATYTGIMAKCSSDNCSMGITFILVEAWQALPRPDESVLEVAQELRELQADDALDHGVPVITLRQQFGVWATRLEQSAPAAARVDTGDCSTCSRYLSSYADGSCRLGNDTKRSMCRFHSEYKEPQ